MPTLAYVIFFSLIGGIVSLIGGILLLRHERTAKLLAEYATPLAAGALIAAVFLDLLHEGIEESEPLTVLMWTLIGVLIFFYAERFLRWFHHHHGHDSGPLREKHDSKRKDPTVSLIIAGDTMHNALDGVAIAAAFLISIPTGIVTTIAIAAHEIPQEIGDFGLLLSKGMSRKKVLLVNVCSAIATTALAIITYLLGSADRLPIGALLGLSAGFLLYIALSDIIPTIHENSHDRKLLDVRPLMVLVGVLVVAVAVYLAHGFIEV